MDTQPRFDGSQFKIPPMTPEGDAHRQRLASTRIDEAPHLFALERVELNLKSISPGDIGELRTAIESLDIEDIQAVQTCVDLLQSIRQLEDKKGALQRATRKLEDIARGYQVMQSLEGKIKENIILGTKFLLDAVYAVATPAEQQAVGQNLGGTNDDDIATRRDELMKIHVQ